MSGEQALRQLHPEDVSPFSPYRLQDGAQFVVAEECPDHKGKVLIKSQHRSFGAALDNRKRVARGRRLSLSKWPKVYEVIREGGRDA